MIRALTLLLATLFLAAPALGADLDGTLKKIKSTNTITLGYREDARPFAFVGDDGKPAGYSVDLCTRIAASVAKELALPNLGRTSKNPEKLALIDEFFSYEPHGFMLKRGDAGFRLSVNRALAAMYRTGEVAPIFEKSFGSMTTAAPIILNMYLINGLPE